MPMRASVVAKPEDVEQMESVSPATIAVLPTKEATIHAEFQMGLRSHRINCRAGNDGG